MSQLGDVNPDVTPGLAQHVTSRQGIPKCGAVAPYHWSADDPSLTDAREYYDSATDHGRRRLFLADDEDRC